MPAALTESSARWGTVRSRGVDLGPGRTFSIEPLPDPQGRFHVAAVVVEEPLLGLFPGFVRQALVTSLEVHDHRDTTTGIVHRPVMSGQGSDGLQAVGATGDPGLLEHLVHV